MAGKISLNHKKTNKNSLHAIDIYFKQQRRINKNSMQAFTLVELLVVIAIISILAGMLMPALENAIEASRAIGCSSNVKQGYMAFEFYRSDYDYYPMLWNKRLDGGAGNWAFYTIIDIPYDLGGFSQMWENKVATGNIPSVHCPTYLQNPIYYTNGSAYNFGVNANLFGKYDIPIPSKYAMIADCVAARIVSLADDNGVGIREPDFRHGNDMANVCFGDGHVQAVERAQVPTNDVGEVFWMGE